MLGEIVTTQYRLVVPDMCIRWLNKNKIKLKDKKERY